MYWQDFRKLQPISSSWIAARKLPAYHEIVGQTYNSELRGVPEPRGLGDKIQLHPLGTSGKFERVYLRVVIGQGIIGVQVTARFMGRDARTGAA